MDEKKSHHPSKFFGRETPETVSKAIDYTLIDTNNAWVWKEFENDPTKITETFSFGDFTYDKLMSLNQENSGSEECHLVLMESAMSQKESDAFLTDPQVDSESIYAYNEDLMYYDTDSTNSSSQESEHLLKEQTTVTIVPTEKAFDKSNIDENNPLTVKTNLIKKDYSRKITKQSIPSSPKIFVKIPCKIDDPAKAASHKCNKCEFMCGSAGCTFSTKFKQIFVNHCKNKHKQSSQDNNPSTKEKLKQNNSNDSHLFTCEYCDFTTKEFVSFVLHMQGKSSLKHDFSHPHEKVLVCGFKDCIFLTQNREFFERHKAERLHWFPTKRVASISLPKKEAQKCDKTAKAQKKEIINEAQKCGKPVEAQKKKHNLKVVYSCIYCPAKFKAIENLIKHISTHEQNNVCSTCNEAFYSLEECIEHEKNHSKPEEEKQFSCALCGFKAPTMQRVKDHIKLCGMNFRCQYCDVRKRSLAGIKKHEATHLSINLTCNFCFLQFANKDEMIEHYFHSHSDVANCIIYNCKYCWFKAHRLVDFNFHFVDSHNATVVFYQCPVCSIETEILVEYQIHFLQHIKC